MRSQFFSFIFQQENMFKSVSALENMLLTTLRSSEREEQEANERIAEMAQTLLSGCSPHETHHGLFRRTAATICLHSGPR